MNLFEHGRDESKAVFEIEGTLFVPRASGQYMVFGTITVRKAEVGWEVVAVVLSGYLHRTGGRVDQKKISDSCTYWFGVESLPSQAGTHDGILPAMSSTGMTFS